MNKYYALLNTGYAKKARHKTNSSWTYFRMGNVCEHEIYRNILYTQNVKLILDYFETPLKDFLLFLPYVKRNRVSFTIKINHSNSQCRFSLFICKIDFYIDQFKVSDF